MNEMFNFLDNLLKFEDHIVVATSGGPDSMCLLSILLSYQKKLNLKIICAHVNHKLRKESEDEKKFVQDYCLKNNVTFEYMEIDSYTNNKFTESEARKKRYQFFDTIVTKYHAKYLMTAHHGNDLEETILMRIVRGSNLKGYVGIPRISENENYKIIRPLISVSKKEILNYLKENKIPYVVDKSNEDEKYTRNRYRKHMLPMLEKEDESVHLKFWKFSEELQSYQKFVQDYINKVIGNIYKDNCIDIKNLLKEDEFIQRKIIEYVITDIQKDNILNINDKQFKEILKLINNNSNKQINLADNFIARRSYNKLFIEKNINNVKYNYVLEDELNILDKYHIKRVDVASSKSNNIIRLNSEELTLPLIVRTINDGDKMAVKNLDGTKKVSDIFKDSKIDNKKRVSYPIVTDSKNVIIWIPGIKKSIFDKEISEKYDIILKCTEE